MGKGCFGIVMKGVFFKLRKGVPPYQLPRMSWLSVQSYHFVTPLPFCTSFLIKWEGKWQFSENQTSKKQLSLKEEPNYCTLKNYSRCLFIIFLSENLAFPFTFISFNQKVKITNSQKDFQNKKKTKPTKKTTLELLLKIKIR